MPFYIKELFYTIQGEGVRTGRPAVFCRFAGCNLWSGKEADRHTAQCQFCDTNFIGADAGIFNTEEELIKNILLMFPPIPDHANSKYIPYVVFTGGEPALQLTEKLITLLQEKYIETAIETNGTLLLPSNIDWITVSPKGTTSIVTTSGNELKLVWPQKNCSPETFLNLSFDHFILQPKDDRYLKKNIDLCIDYCMQHPQWRLGLQSHKWIGIP